MSNEKSFSFRTHAFVVRIWWEPGLTHPNGRPLWRGQVEHATSGRSYVFQSLDDLLCFIQAQTGELENGLAPGDRDADGRPRKPMVNLARRDDDERQHR